MDSLTDPAVREEVAARLILQALPGVGTAALARLLEAFGSGGGALAADGVRFNAVAGTPAARHRSSVAIESRVRRVVGIAEEMGVRVALRGRQGYPERLEHLTDPPPVLFLRGNASLLGGGGVAVVGSRRATRRGRDTAAALGRHLAARGTCVLSGLALGVDAAAHGGALGGGGVTLAVLGTGVDRPYPRAHAPLFRRIAEEGLLVSEFPPGTPALPHHFPRRNRILAALADTVVVVEAAGRSGALITAEHALDLGREVWAVPGPIDTPSCAGSNALLNDGARALISVQDFVDAVAGVREPSCEAPALALGGAEGRVLAQLAEGPQDPGGVAAGAGLEAGETLAVLAALEVKGLVTQLPGLLFRRADGA